MALKEQDILFTTQDEDGNSVIQMPITRVENVEGAIKDISISGTTITITYVDGATKKLITQDDSVPVGTVIAFAGNSAPSGYLLCNGTSVSRTTYAKLFAVIGTIYGSGDGSTTFMLPNLIDKFIQGSTTAGTVKEAGLPNIQGRASFQPHGSTLNGAFTTGSGGSGISGGGSQFYGGCTQFDASLSNPIYGASDTVQPPAVTMRYYIKY